MQYTPKFFLESDIYGRVEITEPMKADGLTFTTEQDKGRWGRDVTFGAEEISLYFANCYGMAISTPQAFPDGSQLNHLSMGLPYILAAKAISGFETEMRFIISYEGIDFPFGLLDYSTGKSDGLNYWEGKIIQDTKRAEVKRNAETNIDVYSDKNLNGEAITPIETVDVLLPALPLQQSSTWESIQPVSATGQSISFTDFSGVDKKFNSGVNTAGIVPKTYGVERSLGYISSVYSLVPGANGGFYPNGGNDFTFIECANELTNIVVDLSEWAVETKQISTHFENILDADGRIRLVINVGTNFTVPRLQYVLYQRDFGYTESSAIVAMPTEFTQTIPLVLGGERIYIYVETDSNVTFDDLTTPSNYVVSANQTGGKVAISATATSVSTITTAAYLVKLYEQVLKSITSELTLVAPRFYTGKYAPIVAFNGFGLRGFTDKPWNNNWKDLTDGLATFNADTQITDTSVFMARMEDFYPDRELDVFTQVPDVDFEISTNERATVNLIELKCSGYLNDTVQETDEAGTLDSVHTELQGKTPNRLVENSLKIETKFVLDGRAIEQQRKLANTTKPSSSTNNDNKNYIADTIPIPEGTLGGFTRYLLINTDEDGNMQILNSTGSQNSVPYFFWDRLGFSEGSLILVSDGDGVGYEATVLNIDPNVLTIALTIPPFTSDSGAQMLTFEYAYDNVFVMARRSEEFVVTGTESPESYYNLQYTPNRLLRDEYGAWLANICRWHPEGNIDITKFINNGALTTSFNGGISITENAPIYVPDLPPPVVTDEIVKTRVAVGFERAKLLYEKMEEIHEDGTIGGYVTVQNSVGGSVRLYSQKASYLWLSGIMDVTGEVKDDNTLVQVFLLGGILAIESRFGTGEASSAEWSTEVDGDNVRVLGVDGEILSYFTNYTRFRVDGVAYNSVEALVAAIGSNA